MMDRLEKVIEFSKAAHPQHNWEGHILPMVQIALDLVTHYGGAREIVEPAAYLHDIGRVRFNYLMAIGILHEQSGAWYMRRKLPGLGYSDAESEHIAGCIKTHSGPARNQQPTTLEAEIIMNADGAVAFETVPYLFHIHHSNHGKDLKKTNEWLKRKWANSWQKLTLPGMTEKYRPIYHSFLRQVEQ